jgi:NADH:ubiquinone oxidoreductase subunit C
MKFFLLQLGSSISSKLPKAIKSFVYANGELTLNVDHLFLSNVLFFLKYHTNFQYKVLTDVTAVDYPDKSSRFEVVYQLLSLKYNSRIRIKANINELDSISTVSDIFPSAG